MRGGQSDADGEAAEQVRQVVDRLDDVVGAGGLELAVGPEPPAHADRQQAVGVRRLDVVVPVAHHHDLGGIGMTELRERVGDDLGLRHRVDVGA